MHLRTLLSGTLAFALLTGPAVLASERSDPAVARPSPGLPGVFGSRTEQKPVRVAQAADPRVSQLEEQIRALNGTVEELNFQILQMQEQIRKMQEDNEFRFQELEKRTDAKAPAKSDAAEAPKNDGVATAEPPSGVEDIIAKSDPAATAPATTGEPPKTLGTITVDPNGEIKSAPIEPAAPADGTSVVSLPTANSPDELYRNAYEFILSGDYPSAEAGFRDHIARYPDDQKAADAHYWLGESLLGQQKYRDAAEVFLAASKDYPKSKKGPDILLKLGMSLAGLNQREVACATFGEIGKRYPQVSGALRDRVKQEQALAAC
jgi:tol-pal system protein YbgF